MRIAASVAALFSVLALGLAAGCGGDDSSSGASATEDWANDVCTAVTDWTTAMTSVGSSLQGGDLSKDSLDQALDDVRSATDQFAEDIRGLGRPDTESGQQAKAAIDELATNLEASLQKITDAMDNASGTAGAVAAATAIANNLVEMGNQVSTASQKLQDIDAQGELGDAFAQADSCAGLTGTS